MYYIKISLDGLRRPELESKQEPPK